MFAVAFMLCLPSGMFALDWGTNELDNEKLAIKICNEVKKGGYGIVTTGEFKSWLARA